ncbi:hypothetical protein KCP75_13060 [Salmonella enterica subsp. enterica]|nr:hypothetical protein KCP75_13060 [Salmonella enterica subsp. enterica]
MSGRYDHRRDLPSEPDFLNRDYLLRPVRYWRANDAEPPYRSVPLGSDVLPGSILLRELCGKPKRFLCHPC